MKTLSSEETLTLEGRKPTLSHRNPMPLDWPTDINASPTTTDILHFKLPDNTYSNEFTTGVVEQILKNHPSEAILAGGAVRDLFLNRTHHEKPNITQHAAYDPIKRGTLAGGGKRGRGKPETIRQNHRGDSPGTTHAIRE